MKSISISLLLVIYSWTSLAQSNGFSNVQQLAMAGYVEEEILIDGEVLNDDMWRDIKPIENFTQLRPYNGQPASERTEVRIAVSNTMFYFSAVCYDAEVERLIVTDAKRDGSLDDTDAIIFIVDTYNDSQNGFVFGTNSLGIEYDAQVDNEGQGNFVGAGQQRGVIGGFNINWDATWEVKTQVGGYGWTAEFAIPLSTLRFRPGENQTWGLNIQRNIQKTNEVDYWAPLPLGFELSRLSMAGKLEGLKLRRPGNFKLIPYVLGDVSDANRPGVEADYNADVGMDIKYSVTSALTLDLTYNTDFAQVEVDDQQVNLDRFNLFFPEKRPFFLENAGQFTVGAPGEVDLFFTRRIGIGQNGLQVPIIGGGRLSGKANRTNIGLLSMYTDEVPEAGIVKNSFSVIRLNHEFVGRSSIGGIFVNKESLGGSDHFNRTFALDGQLGLGKKAEITGFIAGTSGPDEGQERERALQLGANYNWDGWRFGATYTEVGSGFNPEVGFLRRTDFRKYSGIIFRTMRYSEESALLEIRPHIVFRGFWGFDGFRQTSWLHIDNHWVWKSRFEIHTGFNVTGEGVQVPFEINPGVVVPAGTYDHVEAQIFISTNESKPVSFRSFVFAGGAFGGTKFTASPTLNVRLGDRFNAEFGLVHSNFSLPAGDFTVNVLRSRLAYNFTPSIFVQSLIQYNNVSKLLSSNVRFGWLQKANSGLFVVFNGTRQRDHLFIPGDPTSPFDETASRLTVKYSYVFDVLK